MAGTHHPLLDAVRERIHSCEADLEHLHAMEQHALALCAEQVNAEQPTTLSVTPSAGVRPRPKAPARTTSGRDGLSDKQQRVLEAIRGGKHRPREIAVTMGETGQGIKHALQILVARGLIVAEGVTRSRTYRPVVTSADAPNSTAKLEERKVSNARRMAEGVLRAKVLAAINDHPDRFNEEALVGQTGDSRDDVADACGRLLLDGKIALNPDGTYGRPAREAA